MPTAYLIVAHHQPNHLARLIRTLDTSKCAFFVHIDAKVDDTIFKDAVGKRANVVFSRRRWKVNWGGFSQVEATMTLLSEAMDSSVAFQRFCLLSGSDFPIKTNGQILSEFDSDKEFMRIDRKLLPLEDNVHCRNVGYYWFLDSSFRRLEKLSGRLKRQPYRQIDLYHGSNWWALTRNCIEYVLRFLSSTSRYRSFFKYTRCADEVFFHSIVKHSPFAPRIIHDFETPSNREKYSSTNEHGCHYIDWGAKIAKLPKILELEDLDKLLSCKSLFARKFDENKSAKLIAKIESMLAG
jgi:hypothetical protein